MDKRAYTRVPFETTGILRRKPTRGVVANVSLNGLFLETEDAFDIDEAVDITIELSGTEPPLRVELTGHVVRREETGVAVQFDANSLELEAVTHLRRIVELNAEDNEVQPLRELTSAHKGRS